MKKIKPIPCFKSEKEERVFWQKHSTVDYFDTSKHMIIAYPNLKSSTKTISLRLPESLLNEIKKNANKRDVPYQSLMKIYLADRTMNYKQDLESYK